MKGINKILIISAGLALSIGGCIVGKSAIKSASAAETTYVKVTENSEDLSGNYLVVCEAKNDMLNATGTSEGTPKAITITDSVIVGDYSSYEMTFTKVSGGYTIKGSGGRYIYHTGTGNTINYSTSAQTCTVSIGGTGNVSIVSDSRTLQHNSSGSSIRFYSSTQTSLQLYKVGVVKTVTGISVKTPATKLSYLEGESFDSTGTVLSVSYNTGDGDDITEGYTYTPKGALAATDTTITYSYKDQEATQAISVSALSSLSKTGTLTKTTYNDDDSFDPTGLTITATYANGETKDVTALVTWEKLVKGETSVKGTYCGKEITIDGLTIKGASLYRKITATTDLKDGQLITFVSESKGKVAGAMVESSSTKHYISTEDITITDNSFTVIPTMSTYRLKDNGDGTWQIANDEYRLGAASASNQAMLVDGTNSNWTITFTSAGNATIKNTAYATYLCHNDATTRFTTYGTSQGNVQIYAKSAGDVDTAITDIELDSGSVSQIALNNSISLKATLTGGADMNKEVIYTTSDSTVFEIPTGKHNSGDVVAVKGIGVGTATITATAAGDESISKSVEITVVDPSVATEVRINNGAAHAGICHVDNTTTLTATVYPEVASNKNVTWSSSDETVATVDSTGKVTSHKEGKITITAKSVLTPTVEDTIDFYVFSQKGSASTCPMSVGDVYRAMENNVWPADVDTEADAESLWLKGVVSNVPTVKSGKYSFEMVGAAGEIITIKAMATTETITIGSTVKMFFTYLNVEEGHVINAPTLSEVTVVEIPVTDIVVTGPTTLKAGLSATYTATLTPAYTTQTAITWETSDATVATVSEAGEVTGVAAGNVVITARSSANTTVYGTINVEITDASAVAGSYVLTSNGTGTYDTTVTYSNVASFLNGFDSTIMASYTAKNIGFGYASAPESIYLKGGANFNIVLTAENYSISEVIIEAKTTSYETVFTCGNMNQEATTSINSLHFYPFSNSINIETDANNAIVDSITLVVVANSNTSALVDTYAKAFLSETAEDCSNLNVTADTWSNVTAAFTNLSNLSTEAGLEVMEATANASGTDLEKAAARYDFIVAKYKSHTDFLGRVKTSNNTTINPANIQLLIVVISSISAISLLATCFVLKKKKSV